MEQKKVNVQKMELMPNIEIDADGFPVCQTIAKPTVGGSTVNKPNKPIEPLWKDFPTPILPNGTNHLGEPLFQKLDWIEAKKKYDKELKKYEADLENYEQTKLIRLLKNSNEKYCLKAFKIVKR